MKYGEFLKEGDTIGFVAPSFGCNIEPYLSGFNNARNKFQNMGYKTVAGPNCYEGKGIGISNTPQQCGKELMDFYLSTENKILMSCGGGELMCEILDYVDFEQLKAAPAKWYMGYSDNTNMTFLLATLCDVASIYGPCAPAFGMKEWHKSIVDAMNVLIGGEKQGEIILRGYDKWEKESRKDEEHPLEPYYVTEEKVLHIYQGENIVSKAVMQGRLLGGCMDCLVNLTGTKYDQVAEFSERYKEDGIIWFLESCDLNVFAIRRAIWQMEHAGWFQHVKGFIIGRPLIFGQEMMGLNQYNAVMDLLAKFQVPVIMDADIGHLPPMMPLITGSKAVVVADGNELEIKMECK